MRKYIFFLVMLVTGLSSRAATVPVSPAPAATITLQQFASLPMKKVQELAGRKLTLKEKIAVKIFQWKIKKGIKPAKNADVKNKGKTALIFSIIGLASLLIPVPVVGFLAAVVFTVLGLVMGSSAKKANKDDGNAKAAVVIGWVTTGLFVIGLVIATVILATWSWW